MARKLTQEEFVARINDVHENKYDYSKTVYTITANKVKIICSVHGEFEQIAGDHLRGRGCNECGNLSIASNTSVFIKKAEAIHEDSYDYTLVTYTTAKTKVEIICPYHGIFTQTPNDHLNGCGCRYCRTENIGWTDSKWSKQGEISSNFTGYKLYIIKCYDGDETFIKIGKTFVPTYCRFKEISKYYSYKVLCTVEADASSVCKLERKYQRLNMEYKYIPAITFNGYTECFSKVIIEGITYE